jgi:hypothetical protein
MLFCGEFTDHITSSMLENFEDTFVQDHSKAWR